MLFKLKQEKLQELLEKLILVDIFMSSVITVTKETKTGKPVLFSIQKEAHGRAFRYVKFNNNFFDEIEPCEETIELDIDRTLSIVKKIKSGTLLTVETEGNKLKITGEYRELDEKGNLKSSRIVSPHISYKEPTEANIIKEMPFTFDDGCPVIGEQKLKIDNKFEVSLEDIKEITEFANTVKTEYYQITSDGEKLSIRVGDLHDFSDFVNYTPRFSIKSGKGFKVILSYALPEVASTLRVSPINCVMKNEAPAWFSENTDEYLLGILIPPYVIKE